MSEEDGNERVCAARDAAERAGTKIAIRRELNTHKTYYRRGSRGHRGKNRFAFVNARQWEVTPNRQVRPKRPARGGGGPELTV